MIKPVRFSIGVPAYNTDISLLQKCLLSILNQTYENYQVIFIDDHSESDLCSVVGETIGNDTRFILLRNETNQGATQTRKKIINRANGDYFIWVDSDDYIELDFLEQCVKLIEQRNINIEDTTIVCNAFLHKKDNEIVKLFNFNKNRVLSPEDATSLVLVDRILKSYPWIYIIPVNIIKFLSFDDAIDYGKQIIDDLAVSYQYVKYSKSVLVADICCYHHIFGVIGSDSNTGNLRKRIINTSYFLIEKNRMVLSKDIVNCINLNILFNEVLLLKKESCSIKDWKRKITTRLKTNLKGVKIPLKSIRLLSFRFYTIYFLMKYFKLCFCKLLWLK